MGGSAEDEAEERFLPPSAIEAVGELGEVAAYGSSEAEIPPPGVVIIGSSRTSTVVPR
jgi:hypothetical protein